MTIDELHDYCRYLFDENHAHGVPDKWSEGYEFALSLVMFKCHEEINGRSPQESSASSKTTESEQTENPKQAAGREIDTSEYPFIQLEADELVRMICDAYQTGVFSGKEQS